MLNEYKTTGWIASDFIRTMKTLFQIHRNVDTIIKNDFNVNNYNNNQK